MDNKKKIGNISNIILVIIISILLLLEVCTWMITLIKGNSTINIFGYKPYIVMYEDTKYNLNDGDLTIGKELKNKDEYNNNTGILYKATYKDDKTAVILNNSDYEKIKNNSVSRYEGKINFSLKRLGKFVLFMREIYAVLMIVIILIIAYSSIYYIRKNKKEDLPKEYIRNRKIKDIIVILFIITTYVSIFFIGELKQNAGTQLVDNKNGNNTVENDISNNVDNIVENTIINNNVQNGTTHNNNQNVNTTINNSNIKDSTNNSSNNTVIDSGINVIITEKDKSWTELERLSIFNNEFFKGENKIAPGVYGSYEFKVDNQSKSSIVYNIKMSENNSYKINLKYRIRKNGQYLNDEYVSADNLQILKQQLESYGKDTYIIDWKWFDSDNDTEIGKNAENVKYNLFIKIDGEME